MNKNCKTCYGSYTKMMNDYYGRKIREPLFPNEKTDVCFMEQPPTLPDCMTCPENKEDPKDLGLMIDHYKKLVGMLCENRPEHARLARWLEELQALRKEQEKKQDEQRNCDICNSDFEAAITSLEIIAENVAKLAAWMKSQVQVVSSTGSIRK